MRVTGSGLGCPTWPECVDGSITPTVEQAEGFHKYIEFGNRTLTGVLGILAAGDRRSPSGRGRPAGAMSVASVVVLGGVVAQARPRRAHRAAWGCTRPPWPPTSSCRWCSSWRRPTCGSPGTRRPARPARSCPPRRPAGVGDGGGWARWCSRSAPSSPARVRTPGDADEPDRFGLDARTVSWLHADVVMLFLGLVVATWLAARLTAVDDERGPARAWLVVLGVALAQGLIGYVQYFTDLPEALVVAHMLGASLLVVALTNGILALRAGTDADAVARSPVSRASPRSSSRPAVRATATASPREVAPSLARMFETWTLAVFVLMNRARPISPFERPSATSASTSASRAVSVVAAARATRHEPVEGRDAAAPRRGARRVAGRAEHVVGRRGRRPPAAPRPAARARAIS